MRRILTLIVCTLIFSGLYGQELNFTVKINTQKLQTVDPKVFETLESTMREFLNSTKWTDDVFEPEEQINCNIQLTIQEERSATSFKADLAISASRPVFGSSYETALLNHIDKDVTFVYEQFQPLQYSRNAYNDNLSQVLSFYVYIILGMDYDSFSLLGGEPYFQTSQDIVNSVPQNAAAANPGWQSIEGNRNRFWMIENILSARTRLYREAMYNYHRQALDIMADDVATGRAIMLEALEDIGKVNQTYPNSMIVQMFNNAKSQEIIEIFKGGDRTQQDRLIRLMSRIDASNSSKYRSIK
jgi:hypothetical protein